MKLGKHHKIWNQKYTNLCVGRHGTLYFPSNSPSFFFAFKSQVYSNWAPRLFICDATNVKAKPLFSHQVFIKNERVPAISFPAPLGDTKCDLCADLTVADQSVRARVSVTYTTSLSSSPSFMSNQNLLSLIIVTESVKYKDLTTSADFRLTYCILVWIRKTN